MKRLVAALLLLFLTASSAQAVVFPNWPACFRFMILGPCWKLWRPGVLVIYWVPTVVIETSPQCGISVVPEAIPQVAAVSAPFCEAEGPLGKITKLLKSSYRPPRATGDLHFAEAHVVEYPFDTSFVKNFLEWMCLIPQFPAARLLYASEADVIQWRTGGIDLADPLLAAKNAACLAEETSPLEYLNPVKLLEMLTGEVRCMGHWGPLYPRTGWMTVPSHLTHSAAVSFRAVHLAGKLYHTYWAGITPLDSLQLSYPTISRCIQIGEPPLLWETGQDVPLNLPQHFVWIYWRFVACCM